ncbi:MAG: hypothetical protein J7L15_00955 [Clostridiales bacterium]|nr:hypothetical protein [Clostridiales bacterium]
MIFNIYRGTAPEKKGVLTELDIVIKEDAIFPDDEDAPITKPSDVFPAIYHPVEKIGTLNIEGDIELLYDFFAIGIDY